METGFLNGLTIEIYRMGYNLASPRTTLRWFCWQYDKAVRLRCWLFVPGHRLDRLPRALEAGADGVIVDLEDAVAPQHKAEARRQVSQLLHEDAAPHLAIRINSPGTRHGLEDLWYLSQAPAPALWVLPKAEASAELELVRAHLAAPMLPLIETPRGVEEAVALAQTPGVVGLALGGADLAVRLGAQPGFEALWYARSRLVQAAALNSLPVMDMPFFDYHDLAGLERESQRVREMGLRGKLAIHPAQVPVIQQAFRPSRQQLDWAGKVVAAFAQGTGGAVALEGQMIDEPLYRLALATLAGEE